MQPKYKAKYVDRTCKVCGTVFSTTASHHSIHCSPQCVGITKRVDRGTRFWPRVEVSAPDSCWLWTGGKFTDGYGAFWDGGNNRRAHQVAWEIHNKSKFPDGLQGNHSCDTPLCCNPSHVIPGTKADNASDMVKKSRSLVGEKHPMAKRSAEMILAMRAKFDEDNTITSVALQFGQSYSETWRIVTRRSWRHI